MLKPKKYSLNDNLTKELIHKYQGFVRYKGGYLYKRRLYGKIIFLYIRIQKTSDGFKTSVTVEDNNTNGLYAPFYNENQQYNNEVYCKVVENYNDYMDDFVKKNIFIEDK